METAEISLFNAIWFIITNLTKNFDELLQYMYNELSKAFFSLNP